MKLSTSHILLNDDFINKPIEAFDRNFSMLKGAGFERVDICFWELSKVGAWFSENGWEETVAKIGDLSEKYDLPINQTHANTYSGKQWDDPDYPLHDHQTETTLRAIKATAMLGGKWVVIHPMNLPHDPLYSPKKAKEAAIAKLEPYVNERGGIFRAGTGSAMYYVWHAENLGATADGRDAYDYLPCNFSESMFMTNSGPLSVLIGFAERLL